MQTSNLFVCPVYFAGSVNAELHRWRIVPVQVHDIRPRYRHGQAERREHFHSRPHRRF